ncbi:hypothetical protein ACFFRR_004630 [Megaselia abdita]
MVVFLYVIAFLVHFVKPQSTPYLSLTVSAKWNNIEITYRNFSNYSPGDIIFLTDHDPVGIPSSPLEEYRVEGEQGYKRTHVHYSYSYPTIVGMTSGCHKIWALYVTSVGEIIYKTCLKNYPTWMNDMLPNLGNLSLRSFIIPGTHDSGSYRENQAMKNMYPLNYYITQDDNILGQLIHGARYLDIRPAYYEDSKDKWYVNHDFVIQQPLTVVMDQVIQFVKETKEVVIFGLKEFPVGFSNFSRHTQLVEFMESYFGDYIVRSNGFSYWSMTLNEIVSHPKARIILAYDKESIFYEYRLMLFPGVFQHWGNKRTWPALEAYLRKVQRSSIFPNSDMAELTPSAWDVLTNPHGGLSQMADDVNLRLSNLYENELLREANIISVDFIRGTRIVELAVKANEKRFNIQ